MKRKRNFQTSIYLALRYMSMLCKGSEPAARKIHIAKTIYPDGRETIYDAPLDSMPENTYSTKTCNNKK